MKFCPLYLLSSFVLILTCLAEYPFLAAGFVTPGSNPASRGNGYGLVQSDLNNRIGSLTTAMPSLANKTSLWMGFLDDVQGFMKRFTTKATASHILVKGGAEAEHFLDDLKVEIDNNPVKFAEAAAKHSSCPSASQGGNLGEFGPGQMVKEFDTVVFNDEVGVVHGPVKTQVSP